MKLIGRQGSCCALFLLVVTLLLSHGHAKRILLKVNLGTGARIEDFVPEKEALHIDEDIPATRFHGEMGGIGTDLEVFRTQRFSRNKDLVLNFPVPDGIYKVTLLFAETWEGAFTRGARVFDVFVGSKPNGILKVLPAFDMFATAGGATAIRRSVPRVASHGGITVALRPLKQNPQIAGVIFDGHSYQTTILGDLPTEQVDGPLPDTTSVNLIGPVIREDPALVYDPAADPQFRVPGSGSAQPAAAAGQPGALGGFPESPSSRFGSAFTQPTGFSGTDSQLSSPPTFASTPSLSMEPASGAHNTLGSLGGASGSSAAATGFLSSFAGRANVNGGGLPGGYGGSPVFGRRRLLDFDGSDFDGSSSRGSLRSPYNRRASRRRVRRGSRPPKRNPHISARTAQEEPTRGYAPPSPFAPDAQTPDAALRQPMAPHDTSPFGQDGPRTHLSSDLPFGRDAAPPAGSPFGQDGTASTGSAFARDAAPPTGAPFGQDAAPPAGSPFGQDAAPPAGSPFGQDAAHMAGSPFGQDASQQFGDAPSASAGAAPSHYGLNAPPQYGNEAPGAPPPAYGQDAPQVQFGQDTQGGSLGTLPPQYGHDAPAAGGPPPQGAYGQDAPHGGYGQDVSPPAPPAYGADAGRGAFGEDAPRGGYGQDSGNAPFGQDAPGAAPGQETTRPPFAQDAGAPAGAPPAAPGYGAEPAVPTSRAAYAGYGFGDNGHGFGDAGRGAGYDAEERMGPGARSDLAARVRVPEEGYGRGYGRYSAGVSSPGGGLNGVCVHNSTHCSCGVGAGDGGSCLYALNDNSEPLVCERAPCNAQYVCGCAAGARGLCVRRSARTVLVEIGGGMTNNERIVLCERQVVEDGVGVLEPVPV